MPNALLADNLKTTGLFSGAYQATPADADSSKPAGVLSTDPCLILPRASFTYRDESAGVVGHTDFADNGQKLGRSLQESLNKWWNTTIPGSSDYTAAKAANFAVDVGSFQVSSPTVLKRRYTTDIFYKSTNLESNNDTGT